MPDVHLPGETAGDRYTPLAWVARGVALTISVVAVAFPCGVGIYRVFGWRMPTLDVAPFAFPVIEAGLVFLAWYAARVNAGTRVGRAMALFAIAWAMYCAGSLLRLDHHGHRDHEAGRAPLDAGHVRNGRQQEVVDQVGERK